MNNKTLPSKIYPATNINNQESENDYTINEEANHNQN
jgi:hypothetical protein